MSMPTKQLILFNSNGAITQMIQKWIKNEILLSVPPTIETFDWVASSLNISHQKDQK